MARDAGVFVIGAIGGAAVLTLAQHLRLRHQGRGRKQQELEHARIVRNMQENLAEVERARAILDGQLQCEQQALRQALAASATMENNLEAEKTAMQECEGALQALREDKTSLQQEKERLAQDLETCQHQGNEARQQLSAVHQRLSDARDAQGAAKQDLAASRQEVIELQARLAEQQSASSSQIADLQQELEHARIVRNMQENLAEVERQRAILDRQLQCEQQALRQALAASATMENNLEAEKTAMQECEGALQALREDKTSLQQEKERLAQDLEICQHQGNEARQQLSAVHQRLSDARDAQGAAKQSDNHLAQAAQQSQKAALGSNQQLQGTAADLTQPLPADEAASAIETASANGAAAHLSQQLAAVQATATSIKALLGGSLDSIPAAAAKADEPAQVQAERPQKGSSLTEAVLLVTAARYAAKLCQELNTAVAQHATLHDRLTRADLPHAGLTGSFDLAQSQLTQAQAQVRGLIAHLKDAHVSAKEKELQLRNEISQTRHDLASQTAQLESSRAAIVSRDAEVANLQQQAAQLQQASQESENMLEDRILRLGEGIEKMDTHVLSLQSMVVFYRHKCGMDRHMHEQPRTLTDREDTGVFPCQRSDFQIRDEIPPEDEKSHLDMFDKCFHDRGDVIHALGRWRSWKARCKSGKGIGDPGSEGKLEPFFYWKNMVYGTNLGAGGEAIVYPAKMKGEPEFSLALKESYDTPRHQWNMEVHILEELRGQPNVIELFDSTWNARTRHGYQCLELAKGGDLAHWIRAARQAKGLTRDQQLMVYSPQQQACIKAMLQDLFKGLDQVHSQGIVHNDVKPTNCLLKTENRELVLADLGSSSYVSDEAGHKVGSIGTQAYLAPERLARMHPELSLPQRGRRYNAQEVFAGDVWAAGISMLQLLLGRHYRLPAGYRQKDHEYFFVEAAFRKLARSLQMDRKHLLGQDALLRHIATEWGQGAIDLLARALHLEPGMRCTAAEALAMPFLA